MHIILYTDGGSRGNPGPAGIGVYMINTDGAVVEKRFKYLGIATNNIAEYTAILLGVRRAIELGATSLEVRADSKLAIEQLSGNYKIKNPELKKIYLEIQGILSDWKGKVLFTHIPREKNIEADRLSNVAMDQGMGR